MTFALTLLVGLGVGVLTGMFGVGGGFLITPLLNVLIGVPMPIAVGTGALQILSVSTAGLYRRRAEKRTDYKLAIVLFGGSYVGVQLGAGTLEALKGLGTLTFRDTTIAAADFWVLCVFLAILSAIAGWLIYDTRRNAAEPEHLVGLFARIKIPPYTDFASLDHPRLSIPVLSYFGLLLGFVTGLLGIGGGVIMLPALVYLIGMRTHQATATSMALVWMSSLIAAITHTLNGNTDLMLAIPLLVGGTIGLQIGVAIGNKLPGGQIKRYFCFVVIAAAALVAYKVIAVVS